MANPFDQFDSASSNPFDQFDEVKPLSPKEPVKGVKGVFDMLTGANRIPGVDYPEYANVTRDLAQNAWGLVEGAGNLITGTIAPAIAPIAAGIKTLHDTVNKKEDAKFLTNYDDMMGKLTYHPQLTEAGETIGKKIGDAVTAVGNPLLGHMVPALPGVRGAANKAAEAFPGRDSVPTPRKTADQIIAEAKAAKEGKGPINMEVPPEMKVKRVDIDLSQGPGTGDKAMAVNRAGQAIPNDPVMAAAQRNAMLRGRMDIDLTKGGDAAGEVLYGDPQGQIFRGHPNEEVARVALERQGDAFGDAATANQFGKQGEPLPGLTHEALRQTDTGPVTNVPEIFKNQSREIAAATEANRVPMEHPNTRPPMGHAPEPTRPYTPSTGVIGRPTVRAGSWRRKQGGAIDFDAISKSVEDLKNGVIHATDYLKSWAGTFNPEAWNYILRDLDDPKSRRTVVLMSPEEFHRLAPPRADWQMKEHAGEKHMSIREGLNSKNGLRDVPFLMTETGSDGVARVTGHEGRHRMDVLKQKGVSLVPVVINDRNTRWGMEPSQYDNSNGFPTKIRPQYAKESAYDRPMPQSLHKMPENRAPYQTAANAPTMHVPKGQRGAIIIDSTPVPPNERPQRPDNINEARSPETIAERDSARKVAEVFPVKNKALDEFDVVRTKEEALALAEKTGWKDISKDLGQKALGSGINFHAAMSNNPVLKFARTVFRDARTYADKFSRQYITDKGGLSPLWTDMNTNERVQVIEALQAADRNQFKIERGAVDLPLNEAQWKFVERFYEADKALYDRWAQKMAEVGLKVPEERTGHFPGVFTGAYKTLVMEGKKVIGVIATDTVAQARLAREHFEARVPGVTFVEQKRNGLSGIANRYYSNIFSGMTDVLAVLAEHDPRFAEVQEIVSGAIRESNNKLFNFNVHELSKKGVVGNDGNRPWMSPERNANDAFKSLIRYFEEGALHHELQPPLRDVRELAATPELQQNMPNTLKYLDKYTKKVTGDDISPLGHAINTIIDIPFKLVPAASFGEKNWKTGLGVGPAVPLKLGGLIKNNMSQLFMGWGNYMFTAAQLVQPMQTGLPFMQFAADRLGLNAAHTAVSMGKGGAQFMLAAAEMLTGKHIPGMDPVMREAAHYAKERGMFTFSEMERAYQGTQTPVGRAKDAVAEVNMKAGEVLTRAPMFMAFTDLLVRGGLEPHAAFPIAENLTQFSMIDYHMWERPMVYSNLGVLGNFASGLTTFKHGFASQQVKLANELATPTRVLKEGADGSYSYPRQGRQATPIAASIGGMIALAGITGMSFYGELDAAYRALTNAFGDEARSIRDDFLQNLPEWANSGLVSNAMDLNVQGKFSSADMVPDSFAKAASPHLEAFGKIIASAIELAKNGDQEGARNLILSITPSGWKGLAESKLARGETYFDPKRGENVQDVLGRDSYPLTGRSETEWRKRAYTGLRSQREAIDRQSTWDARQKEMMDQARKKDIAKEYERRIRNNNLPPEKADKLLQEYMKRGGDPQQLIDLHVEVGKKQHQTERERLQGIPSNNLPSIHRFERYNK